VRGLGDRVGTERFRNAGRSAVEHLHRRLGRDIARAESRSPGGQHQARVVREGNDGVGDRVPLVGDDLPLDLEALARAELAENIAAPVLARSLGNSVGDGQDGNPHTGSFVFSTSRTSSTTISLSIALAMS